MPLQETNKLSLQHSGIDGTVVRFQDIATSAYGIAVVRSNTYIEAVTGAISARRLYLALSSGIFNIGLVMDVTSITAPGAGVNIQVSYFNYGGTKPNFGRSITQNVVLAADSLFVSSAAILAIRSAASDIFLTSSVVGSGTSPTYDLSAYVTQLSGTPPN